MRLRGVELPRACTAHKALNLARLPVPPQPPAAAIVRGGMPAAASRLIPSAAAATLRTCVPWCAAPTTPNQPTHVTQEGEPGHGSEPDQAPERDLRIHQGASRQDRLSADRAGDRQRARLALAVDRPCSPRQARELGRPATGSLEASGDRDPGRADQAGHATLDPAGRRGRRGHPDPGGGERRGPARDPGR